MSEGGASIGNAFERFDTVISSKITQTNAAVLYELRSIFWEAVAELAEDHGFYLGRLKQLEEEVARLRASASDVETIPSDQLLAEINRRSSPVRRP